MGVEFGDAETVGWLRETTIGMTITSAVPPRYEAYATIVIPQDERAHGAHDRDLVERLNQHTEPTSRWWLGYLETGTGTTPFPHAPTTPVYSGWRYVMVKASPEDALTLRKRHWDQHRTLPEIMFPEDRGWLVSTLWDDDRRCVGGSTALIQSLLATSTLDTRSVRLTDDATPPGHVAR